MQLSVQFTFSPDKLFSKTGSFCQTLPFPSRAWAVSRALIRDSGGELGAGDVNYVGALIGYIDESL
jgi:hypothetical protein